MNKRLIPTLTLSLLLGGSLVTPGLAAADSERHYARPAGPMIEKPAKPAHKGKVIKQRKVTRVDKHGHVSKRIETTKVSRRGDHHDNRRHHGHDNRRYDDRGRHHRRDHRGRHFEPYYRSHRYYDRHSYKRHDHGYKHRAGHRHDHRRHNDFPRWAIHFDWIL